MTFRWGSTLETPQLVSLTVSTLLSYCCWPRWFFFESQICLPWSFGWCWVWPKSVTHCGWGFSISLGPFSVWDWRWCNVLFRVFSNMPCTRGSSYDPPNLSTVLQSYNHDWCLKDVWTKSQFASVYVYEDGCWFEGYYVLVCTAASCINMCIKIVINYCKCCEYKWDVQVGAD